MQKLMLQAVGAQKVDERNWPFVQFPRFLPELWSLNSQNLVYFLLFFADLLKKFKSIKGIYMYN